MIMKHSNKQSRKACGALPATAGKTPRRGRAAKILPKISDQGRIVPLSIVADPGARGTVNPVSIYLASLRAGAGRQSMRRCLDRVAGIFTGGVVSDAAAMPWALVRYQHMAALRGLLQQAGYRMATINKSLSAVRGVVRECWRLGMIDQETYSRVLDVRGIAGSRLPAGRALSSGEMRSLFAVCMDGTAAGARDAAMLAMLYGFGLRRAECAGALLADYHQEHGSIRVVGKGNKERIIYSSDGTRAALAAWLRIRGTQPGALLCRIDKSGNVSGKNISAQAIMLRLRIRARQAGVVHCSPHDLRRSYVSDLLSVGVDLSLVQRLAGHASPTTTARYDRRGDTEIQQGAARLHVPYPI